jgi:hypothetical protein
MPLNCCRLIAVLLAMGWAVTGYSAGLNLPPLTGELSGNLNLLEWPGVPPLAWRVTAVMQDGGTKLLLSTTAPGLRMQVEATVPVGEAPGTWRVIEGTADAAAWLPVAQARVGPGALPADLTMSGDIRITGEGTWRGGEPSGTMTSTLANGSARSAAQGWVAEEIAVTSELSVNAGVATLRSAEVRVGSVQAAGLVMRNLRIGLAGQERGRLQVQRAELDLLGGHVAFLPFAFDPAMPAVETVAEFSRIELGDLAPLVPQALAEAHGQVNGRIGLRWSPARGFEPGTGSLTVAPDTPATVRLAATPGFLTQRMPRTIALLPAWLGPLARWFSPENPAYGTLQDIELGRQFLTVESLSLQLYPDGPDAPHSARVELVASPAAGGVVKRVTFTVNVAGPLNQVLRLGFTDGVKVKAGTGP